jgi:hypothetical protein
MNQGKKETKYATKYRVSMHYLKNFNSGYEMEKLRRNVARPDVLAEELHTGSTQ